MFFVKFKQVFVSCECTPSLQFFCTKSTIETLEIGVKFVQRDQCNIHNEYLPSVVTLLELILLLSFSFLEAVVTTFFASYSASAPWVPSCESCEFFQNGFFQSWTRFDLHFTLSNFN